MEKNETFKVLKVVHQKGAFEILQGAPGHQAGRVIRKGDTTIKNLGNGNASKKTSAKLLVVVENNGKREITDIAPEYHEEISSRITQKKLNIIKEQLTGKEFKMKGESLNDSIIKTLKDTME